MKISSIIFFIVMLAMISTEEALSQKIQEKDVPTNIKASFKKKFPSASKAKWSKEVDKYEAEFTINKEETSVLIDASGNILETEIEIKVNQLPPSIIEYVKANYKSQAIKEAAKITDIKGAVTYEAEVKGKDLIFDNNGKFIKETKD